MPLPTLSIRSDYWEEFQVSQSDLEFIYNHLIELETPQTPQELIRALISERIRQEIESLKSQQAAGGLVYLPKNRYEVGQQISFPSLDWKNGTVKSVRKGNNPELGSFEVMEVKFRDGEQKLFAASLADHKLNTPVDVKLDDPLLSDNYVLRNYEDVLLARLTEYLEANPDLVRIAGKWFPRALLVDVNIGHLNLAEAVLEMAEGGPLTTQAILDQIELPTDVNLKLTEFSLNLALQEDGRFDEVGPAGEVLWFLRRLEPEWVQNPPPFLKFFPFDFDRQKITELRNDIQRDIIDELEKDGPQKDESDHLSLSLIFPHWRAGTLPLSNRLSKLLPTAYESPRVEFTFIDRDSKQRISGWVVRAHRYVYGLRDWYQSMGLIPGSLVNIQQSKNPGEAIIWAEKRRPAREWIRTVLVGADGGIVFAMLKQMIVAAYDERMAVAVPELTTLDQFWETPHRGRANLEQSIHNIMNDLAKLSPQGHVHALELYAAVNLTRRCPPEVILSVLTEQPWARHLGDLYFKPEESLEEENT
jgi:hypothetical protein